MQILKNIHYMYLVFAVLFLFEFFIKFFQKNEITWASLALGIGAVFMFFFRRKFAKKFENRYKK